MSGPHDTTSELTPGEVRRTLYRIESTIGELRIEVRDRYHKLSSDLQVGLGPVGAALARLERAEQDIQGLGNQLRAKLDDLEKDVNGVMIKAAWLAGVISTVSFILSLLARKLGG